MVSASVASSNSPAARARLEDRRVQQRLAVEVRRGEDPEGRARAGEGVELVEQPALRIVGARWHPEVDRQPELLRVTVDPAHRRGPALGEALNRPARDLDQELVEARVVVEDRAGSETCPLGDVLHPHADRAPLEQHLPRRHLELSPSLNLVLPPHVRILFGATAVPGRVAQAGLRELFFERDSKNEPGKDRSAYLDRDRDRRGDGGDRRRLRRRRRDRVLRQRARRTGGRLRPRAGEAHDLAVAALHRSRQERDDRRIRGQDGCRRPLHRGHQRQQPVLRQAPTAACKGPVGRARPDHPERLAGEADVRLRVPPEARLREAAERQAQPDPVPAPSDRGPESRFHGPLAERDDGADRQHRAGAGRELDLRSVRPEVQGQGRHAHRAARHGPDDPEVHGHRSRSRHRRPSGSPPSTRSRTRPTRARSGASPATTTSATSAPATSTSSSAGPATRSRCRRTTRTSSS